MVVFLDNTSIHSSGNASDQCAANKQEADELMQTAIWIIFAEHICLNNFGPTEIVDKTELVLYKMGKQGVTKDIISNSHLDHDTFLQACSNAARTCLEDLPYYMDGIKNPEGFIVTNVLPTTAINDQAELFRRVIDKTETDICGAIREDPFEHPNYGAMGYMLAISGELRELIRKMPHVKYWTEGELNNLNAFMRYYYHNALADIEDAVYAPNIGRAKLLRDYREALLTRIAASVDKSIGNYLGHPLPVPSFKSALLQKSRSTPAGMIETALIFREKAKGFRDQLTTFVQKVDATDSDRMGKEIRFIKEITDALEYELKIKRDPFPYSAIDVSVPIGKPTAKLSVTKVIEWAFQLAKRRKVTILSEMSRIAINHDRSLPAMEAYYRRCMEG